MSGIEVLSDAELGKQQFLKPGIPPNSKPEVSSSFINPFEYVQTFYYMIYLVRKPTTWYTTRSDTMGCAETED